MMAIRSILLQSAGVLVGAVLLSACNRTPVAQESTTDNTPQVVAPAQEPGIRVPLILTLRGPDPAPTSGDITMDIEIQANMGIRAPVEMKVALPDGAELVSGQLAETLNITAAGKLQRQLVIRTKAPLTNPVVVTADARDPKGAYGLHAERKYPAPPEATVRAGARPPMARPPQPVK